MMCTGPAVPSTACWTAITRELLQIKRLNQAAFLLHSTRMPVADVSFAVGYDNTSYFYRIFRTYYGMSPKEYRKNG